MSTAMENSSLVEVTYRAGRDGQMIAVADGDVEDAGDDSGCLSGLDCNDRLLDIVTGIVIFINVIIMGVELDLPWHGFAYIEEAMLCVYILDVVLRIKWHGLRSYLSDKSHVLDIVIVAASVCEVWILPATVSIEDSLNGKGRTRTKRGNILANMTMTLRSFRLVRAFRLLKLLKFAKPLYMILQSMMSSFKRVCWVMTLLFVFLYAFSLVFTQLLGRDMMDALPDEDPTLSKMRDNFSTVPRTFFELFRLMCGDVTDFGKLISAEDNVVVPLMYMIFQVSTPWLILSIFTAEVVDTTITTSNNLDREEIAMKALHSRTVQRDKLTNELHALFADLSDGTDCEYVELNALASFLEDEENLAKLNDITGLTAFQAINAWEAMESNGKVEMGDYIDGLVLSSHQSPEHSVLRMEAQIRRMTRNMLLVLGALGIAESRCDKMTEEEPLVVDGNRDGAKLSSALPHRTEEPEVEPDLRREIAQLQRSLQTVQTGLESFLHDRSFTQEAEKKAAVELRKMHGDLSGMSSDFHIVKDLRSELQQLRDEIVQSLYANDVNHPVQRVAGSATACDVHEMRAGLSNVEGEITALRAEIASLCRTFRTDQLASMKRSLSALSERDPKQRADRFVDPRAPEVGIRESPSRLGRTSPNPAGARSLELEGLSPFAPADRNVVSNIEPTFVERRGLSNTRRTLSFQDARQTLRFDSLRERIGSRSNI